MKTTIVTTRPRWQRALRAVMAMGLGALLLAVLLVGLRGAPAHADPGTLYVDGATGSDTTDCTNPAAPCATIGYALAQAGDEIRVAEGTYTETLDVHRSVTLKGGYEATGWTRDIDAHPTIIDGTGANDSVLRIGDVSGAVVEGFTVQNGYSPGEGGGFYIRNADVLISATVIQYNRADGAGGGVWVQSEDGGVASALIVDSVLLSNVTDSSGGGLAANSDVTLSNVEIRSNTARGDGGGLSLESSATISNSRIISNTTQDGSGGGLWATDVSIYDSEIAYNQANGQGSISGGGAKIRDRLLLRGSIVRGNRVVSSEESIGGGLAVEGAEATIMDTIISGNSAQYADSVAIWQATVIMTNCLITGHEGPGLGGPPTNATFVNVTVTGNAGGGINIGGAEHAVNVTIRNSILWGNDGPAYSCDVDPASSNCTVVHSDVEGDVPPGTGNISEDPLFVDAANGDYHLQVGSPCIDAGTPVGAPTHDIEGTPRDAAPDMGAYEWGRFRIFLPLTLKSSTSK